MRSPLVLLLVLLLTAPAAAGPVKGALAEEPSGKLAEGPVLMFYGLYLSKEPDVDPIPGLERVQRERFPYLVSVQEPSEIGPDSVGLNISVPPIRDYAPPEAASLDVFAEGLNKAERAWLPAAPYALAIVFFGPLKDVERLRRDSSVLVALWAEQLGAIPWDEDTRQAFGLKEWKRRRTSDPVGPPDVTSHITFHAYRDGPLVRIVSLGMGRFGLPDLVVHGVPGTGNRSMGNVLNLVAQTLVEGGEVRPDGQLPLTIGELRNEAARGYHSANLLDGAAQEGEVTLRFVRPQPGDADNRLLELVFEDPGGQGPQVAMDQLVSTLYGSEDTLTHTEHDAELLDASRRAMKRLKEIKPLVVDGFEPNEALLVKAPFITTSGGNEWMWVEVVSWEGETIRGILQNDPFEVPSLKAGAHVVVQQGDLFDFIYNRPDGTEEGNGTGAIIQRRTR